MASRIPVRNDDPSAVPDEAGRAGSSIRRAREEGDAPAVVFGLAGRDADLVEGALVDAGLRVAKCADAGALCRGIQSDPGMVLVAEEALVDGVAEAVVDALAGQPSWSDVPLLVRARPRRGSHQGRGPLDVLAPVALVLALEAPLGVHALRSAVRVALRIRRRQHEAKRLRAELADARRSAIEKSRATEDFLATISHELRTPLNAILGWTRMLRNDVLLADKRQRALDTIERNAVAQMQLVEDLLDVSHAIAGELALDRRLVEWGPIVQAVVDALRPAAAAKRLELRVDVRAASAFVIGDAARLRQVVWNVLDNAIKFTPRGGHVRVMLERTGSRLELTISDDGVGIRPDFVDGIFAPFRQADSSATRAPGGLGVGLSIVKHIVELHGGGVRTRSDGAGRGATFVVSLPAAAAPLEGKAGAGGGVVPAAPRGRGRRLEGVRIVVGGEAHDEGVRRALEEAGASVVGLTTAPHSIDATSQVAAADALVFDCAASLDHACAWIRELRASGCAVPALALTCHGRVADRTPTLDAGFEMHLPKPVAADELVDSVAALVEQFGAIARARQVL